MFVRNAFIACKLDGGILFKLKLKYAKVSLYFIYLLIPNLKLPIDSR